MQKKPLILALLAGTAFAGPISPLYLSDGSNIYVRQGNTQIDTWATTSPVEYSLAINSTVRTYSQGFGPGSPSSYEYLLDGSPTGATYTNTVGCCFRDGTTDGAHNYAIRHWPGGPYIYQFDLDWTNPQPLDFGLVLNADGFGSGIAYDSRTDSFWFVAGKFVFNYGRAANLLNYFIIPVVVGDLSSLALDPADDTLWLWYYDVGPGNSVLQQYSTALRTIAEGANPRAPLSSDQIDVFANGAEFALSRDGPGTSVPEPGTLALLSLGLAGLAASRRRKQ